MRALALTSLLSLAGCLVYAQPEPPYAPPPAQGGPPPQRDAPPEGAPGPRADPPPPAPESASPEVALLTEAQAVDAAFRIARERRLSVDRVRRTRLDEQGRWEIELRGAYDRARLLLDGRDGRLLKGKFRARAGRPGR